jgi:hypothetical protein
MKITIRHQHIVEILIILMAFLLVNFLSIAFQKTISFNDGKGWDGRSYYKIAEEFSKGQLPEAPGPFVYRIGTPFLASLLSRDDLLFGFKIANLIANTCLMALFIIWLRLYITDWKIRVLLSMLFFTQWHGPIRFVYFYPAYTDPWAFVFLLAGLIGVHKARAKHRIIVICVLSLVTFVGVMIREIAILVSIALLFSMNPIRRDHDSVFSVRTVSRIPLMFFLPLLFGFLSIAGVHVIATQTNDYSFIKAAIQCAYDKPLLTYVHAWFIAYGPVIIIVVYHWRQALAFLINHQFQLVYLIAVALLGWIGGVDTERFLYWSMPVIYIIIGKVLESNTSLLKSPFFVIVLGLSQCISQRLIWAIPDFPNTFSHSLPILTPIGSKIPYLDLWSYHGAFVVQFISLSQYLLLGLALLVWLNHRAKRLRN